MSLRARIVLSIAGVNLLVTLLLATFFAWDLTGQDRERQAREQQLQRSANQRLQLAFGKVLAGSLVLELPSLRLSGPEICRRLLDHPVQGIIDDGVIRDRRSVDSDWRYRTLKESKEVVPPTGFYLNLKGAKQRSSEFRDARATEKIREAIEARQSIMDGSWIAAPIYLKEFGDTSGKLDATAEPWGGGYFRMTGAFEMPQEWVPSFQSSLYWVMGLGTLLLLTLTWLFLEYWVLRPIASLSRGAERVAHRDYGDAVPGGDRGDEIGRLISSFNSMMSEVQESQRDLKERVEEATQRAEQSRRGLVIAQRLAATGTLASGIAHEINNPLGGMLNAARRLRKETEREPRNPQLERKYLSLISGGLSRIQEIVRRVLRFSPRQHDPVVASVRETVVGAVAFVEHQAAKSRVTIDVEGADAQILAVPGEIQQVFLNLFLNACDAMAPQGGRVQVRIMTEGSRALVQVRDEGPGMTGEQRQRAFDLFYSTKEVGQGTGLGLSVAHHIIDQHGGELWLDSEPRKGSVFTVCLPLAPDPDGAEID